MILYLFLLLITAVIAYGLGSMDTVVIASVFIFKKNLTKLGTGNIWLSNFRRKYGIGGFVLLFLVELVKDLIPIGIGAGLLALKGHGNAGAVFAGFCLCMGRCWPLFYDLKGSAVTVCLFVAAFTANLYVGLASIVLFAAILLWQRIISLATVASAIAVIVSGLIVINESPQMMLCVGSAVCVLLQHVPAILHHLTVGEEKISFREDLSYKFDEKL